VEPIATVLAAAYASVRAAAGASLRWLLACALLVGLGFATKSMQALLALPALFGLYLLAAPVVWTRRIAHLALASGVLLAVSLAWPVAVDLTPEDERPYVGSSESNSQLELLFEYNGLERFFGRNQGVAGIGSAPVSREIGGKGPHRLLNERLAGQIGWLLPLALVGGIAAAGRARPWNLTALVREAGVLDERQRQLLLWGGWFGTMYLFFSFAGFFHRYYLVMLAPAVAALAGIGLVTLWEEYRRRDWRGWLLPATLLLTAAVQVFILLDYADWRGRLGPLIGVLALAGAVLLALARLGPRPSRGLASGGLVAGVVALLLAPLVWTWLPVWNSAPSLFPVGGPLTRDVDSNLTGRDDYYTNALPFLEAKRDDEQFLVATNGALSAARIGLNSGQPVLSLGGFTGQDKAISTAKLAGLVERGEVRFFHWNVIRLDAAEVAEGLNNPYNHDAWIAANCVEVPELEWASFNPGLAGQTEIDDAPHIFDCRPAAGPTS
jgi:4-amino-4-deoxy-L-arabinose transferase-like glycosyltransferase